MVNALKFQPLVSSQEDLDKQGRPTSLIRVFAIYYSNQHFVNSSPENQHFISKEKSVQNFRTCTISVSCDTEETTWSPIFPSLSHSLRIHAQLSSGDCFFKSEPLSPSLSLGMENSKGSDKTAWWCRLA